MAIAGTTGRHGVGRFPSLVVNRLGAAVHQPKISGQHR